jgi:ribosomal protein S18 acetylase RimI-like enzyme
MVGPAASIAPSPVRYQSSTSRCERDSSGSRATALPERWLRISKPDGTSTAAGAFAGAAFPLAIVLSVNVARVVVACALIGGGWRDVVTIVRRMRAMEGDRLRRVRLAALRESPEAFAPTYDAERQRPQSFWDEWASAASAGDSGATFFALADHTVIGMVGAYRPGGRGVAEIFAMWASPAVRGAGVGRRLLRAAVSWAETSDPSAAIGLWVTQGNEAAVRLYSSEGFEATGQHKTLPSNHELEVVRMARPPRPR